MPLKCGNTFCYCSALLSYLWGNQSKLKRLKLLLEIQNIYIFRTIFYTCLVARIGFGLMWRLDYGPEERRILTSRYRINNKISLAPGGWFLIFQMVRGNFFRNRHSCSLTLYQFTTHFQKQKHSQERITRNATREGNSRDCRESTRVVPDSPRAIDVNGRGVWAVLKPISVAHLSADAWTCGATAALQQMRRDAGWTGRRTVWTGVAGHGGGGSRVSSNRAAPFRHMVLLNNADAFVTKFSLSAFD